MNFLNHLCGDEPGLRDLFLQNNLGFTLRPSIPEDEGAAPKVKTKEDYSLAAYSKKEMTWENLQDDSLNFDVLVIMLGYNATQLKLEIKEI
jgi:hypothetical protein